MEIIEEARGIRYEVMEERHVEDVAHCAFNQFYNFEPMTKALRPPPRRFRAWLQGVVEQAARDRLSVVAVDTGTGELAGLLLSDDYAVPPPESPGSGGIEPALALLGELHDRYAALREIGRGEVFHQFILATWPRYRASGVTRNLGLASYLLGDRRGFKRSVCEVTSAISQGFVSSCGYRVLDEIRYAEFEHRGARPFLDLDPAESCKLCEGTFFGVSLPAAA